MKKDFHQHSTIPTIFVSATMLAAKKAHYDSVLLKSLLKEFVQTMQKSGGTDADCIDFVENTIAILQRMCRRHKVICRPMSGPNARKWDKKRYPQLKIALQLPQLLLHRHRRTMKQRVMQMSCCLLTSWTVDTVDGPGVHVPGD